MASSLDSDTLLGIDGWRWIFFLNIPIGIAAFFVVSRNLQLPVIRKQRRIDYLGAVLLILTVVPVLLLAEKGREWGWTSATSLGLIAVAVLAFVGFLPRERAVGEDAILPLRIFKDRVFSVTSGVAVLVGMAMFGGLVLLPLYLQIVKGESPTAGRADDDAVHARPDGLLDDQRPDHAAHRSLPDLPDHRHRRHVRRGCCCSPPSMSTPRSRT